MEKLLLKLYEKNIKVNLENGNLKLNFPKGTAVDEILDEVRKNKEELTAYIHKIAAIKSDFKEIKPCILKDHYVLSSAQRRLYFLYEFDKSSLAYNMPQVVRLSGSLDELRISNAFNQLISRFEILRTRIVVVNDEPVQKISNEISFRLENFNASESEVPQVLKNFIRPFDLSIGPLLRVGLIKLSEVEHILVLDMHHIITDGVSNGILIKSFMTLYNEEILPDLSLQFKDYAEWQQSEEQQKEVLKQKDFWLDLFHEEAIAINLPTDFKRPLVKGHQGKSIGFELSKEETLQLKLINERTGSTLFMTILSVYYVLLNKVTNQEDIVIGTPIAGRQHADLENLIGMFVNTLPLRNYPKAELKFVEFLEAVKSITLECFNNQSYQYESLLDELKTERDTSRNPLFDVLFSYQNFEEPELSIKGLTLSSYNSGHADSKFDISLTAIENAEQLFLKIEYATELFKKETIDRFIAYFHKIVTAIIEDINIKIGDLNVLPETEMHQLLIGFNNTKAEYPNDKTIINLFEEQVLLNGSKQAIVCNNQSLTYNQLNIEVNQLSNYLISSKAVRTQDIIGIYVDRSPKMIVVLLAILKSGASYIALDPECPVERINKIIEESQMKLIITNLSDQPDGVTIETNSIDIVKEKKKLKMTSYKNPNVTIAENDAAYIIYTSGSTGTPKGIVIEHASLLDYCMTFKDYFSVSCEDKVIQQSSLSFDTAVEEIFPALISGASIIILPSGGRDIDNMVQSVKLNKASILSTTPLVLNELNNRTDDLQSLRAIISGGDLLLPGHVNNLIGKFPVYNTYGPSESTVCITYNKIEKLSEVSYIGKPIANREVFITNKEGALCPLSVPGELCVSGKGLARGYLNNELLTEEKFAENKYLNGKRIYRTGDLGKWLPDGTIEFLGRIDNQIKIRGYRVELGEVESQLAKHQDIHEAVVVCQEKKEHKSLVAYYVSEKIIEETVLRSYLSLTLPDYMIPASYVHLANMPLTTNGKPDKNRLPDFETNTEVYHIEPGNPTEEKLLQIWSEVLNTDAKLISANKSFFELGGQSLKAITLINKLDRIFNVEISLREIFDNTTIQSMAKIIEVHLCVNSENQEETGAKINKVII